MPRPRVLGMGQDQAEEAVLPLALDEVLVDDHARQQAQAGRGPPTLVASMTVKSPSPVIMRST